MAILCLALRIFVMRFLHLTVEQFDQIANPNNADIITLAHKGVLKAPMFTSESWGVEGLREYKKSNRNTINKSYASKQKRNNL